MKLVSLLGMVIRLAPSRLLAAVALAAILSSCASTQQVRSIVAESNAALLASQFADLELGGDPSVAGYKPDWKLASRKIDEFVAAHPDQKVAAGALRIRQAMLLIAHQEYELARSAFEEAKELKTDRDKALKALSEPIIWWWQHSQAGSLLTDQVTKAREHLDLFDTQLAKLKDSPDIRDFLAEMRARIGLKRVGSIQATDGTRKREALVDVINRFSTIFTAEDIEALKSGSLTAQSPSISAAQKRRLRALAVIEKAKQPLQSLRNANQPLTLNELNPDPISQGLGELILRQ